MTTKLADRIIRYLIDRGLVDSLNLIAISTSQLFRGLLRGYWLVFIGKGVTIRARRKVRLGRFTRIEDYVEIDGFGDHGLQIGNYCKIGKFSILRVPPVPYRRGSGIHVGDYTTFAEYCFVGGAAPVRIGAHNAFGQYVSLHPQNHLPKASGADVDTISIGICIGDDNWFGAKSTILDGSNIGCRTIFSAGAIVRGDFGSDIMAAGVPAKIKRTLSHENHID